MLNPSKLPLVLAAAAALAAPAAQGAPARHHDDCFLTRDWQGWSAPGESNVIYLRVRMHDVWRVDVTPGTHVRKLPDYFLVNRVRGSDWICSPLDLDLALADRNGFREPLIATSLRKLSPAEVAAIPPRDRPD